MSQRLNRVSKAHVKYKLNRGKIKARLRKQLEEENHADLVALGREIDGARRGGHRIEDIMVALGLKNRNFLYEAWNAFKVTQVVSDVVDDSDTPDTGTPDASEYEVEVHKAGANEVLVKMRLNPFDPFEEHKLLVNSRGQIVDLPTDWIDQPTTALRAAVQNVIKTTAGLFAN